MTDYQVVIVMMAGLTLAYVGLNRVMLSWLRRRTVEGRLDSYRRDYPRVAGGTRAI